MAAESVEVVPARLAPQREARPGVPVLARESVGPARPVTVELGYRLVPVDPHRRWAYRVAGPHRLVWGFSALA